MQLCDLVLVLLGVGLLVAYVNDRLAEIQRQVEEQD